MPTSPRRFPDRSTARQPAVAILAGAAAAVCPTTPEGLRSPALHTISSRRAACALITDDTSLPPVSPTMPQCPSASATREGWPASADESAPSARESLSRIERNANALSFEFPFSPRARRAAPAPDYTQALHAASTRSNTKLPEEMLSLAQKDHRVCVRLCVFGFTEQQPQARAWASMGNLSWPSSYGLPNERVTKKMQA